MSHDETLAVAGGYSDREKVLLCRPWAAQGVRAYLRCPAEGSGFAEGLLIFIKGEANMKGPTGAGTRYASTPARSGARIGEVRAPHDESQSCNHEGHSREAVFANADAGPNSAVVDGGREQRSINSVRER